MVPDLTQTFSVPVHRLELNLDPTYGFEYG